MSLNTLAIAQIPDLGSGIDTSGNKDVLIGGANSQGHDICPVIGECFEGVPGIDIPEYAGGIAGGGDDVLFTDESAAAEVSIVSHELGLSLGIGRHLANIVNGAYIIKTTACDEVALGRFEGTGHDPGGTKGDRLDFIGSDGIPNDELSILRGRY